jgi:hypothetical protein
LATGSDVEVLLDGTPEGPNESQRAFFKQIEDNYRCFLPVVERQLVEGARRNNAPQSFRLVAIDLPLSLAIGANAAYERLPVASPSQGP